MPTNTEGREAVIPDAAARRLATQVARAYRGTYGAHTGLRTLVRSVSVQMLRAGSSPEAIARALADCVLNCPAPALVGPPTATNDAVRKNVLAALVAQYAPDAAVEMIRPHRMSAPPGRASGSPQSSR